jgi:protein SCO1/2
MYKLSIYLIPLLFSSCDFPVRKNLVDLLPRNQIRGRVLVVDTNSSMVRAEVLACGEFLSKKWGGFSGFEKDFAVQPGALNLLSHTNVFRASARETFTPAKGEGFLLTDVWPDDRAERIRVNNVNRLLRRDTLSMGDSMIRSVGDTLPPFALYDQDGGIITTDYFDGSVTVLNFIFTRCSIPEMCPASTMRMKKLQTLAKKTKVPFVRFLSITLDPEFDTPGVLKSYARAYSLDEGNFRLGTANKAVIDDLTRQFGIFRKNVEDLPLDHTMRTMIINSKRQIIYQFPGSQWSVEDFLSRLPEGIEGESVQ